MFSNYLKIAFRNLLRQKVHSFINIAGLAIGLACSMLILLWVQDELSFDRFNERADEIYRVVETQHYANGRDIHVAVTPTALATALKQEVPEVERSTRFAFVSLTVRHGDNSFTEGVAMADPDVFDIFTLPFVEGNPRTALADPHSIVLTQDAAKKYFGNDDPLGKVVKVENRYEFLVTGVIKNIPRNSHLGYDLLAPFSFMKEMGSSLDDWNSNWCYTYVLLRNRTNAETVNRSIAGFLGKHSKSTTAINLQPLDEIHLYSVGTYVADVGGQGDINYVRIFSGIALFVLLIACVNFMNLATARSERRAKEVGLRKVVGANRQQLIVQFFGEAMLMTVIAFFVALVLSQIALQTFNELSGKTLALDDLNMGAMLSLLGIAVFAGLLSGSYPAFVLSSFQPSEAIKGGKTMAAGGVFRRVLVGLQFTLSVMMIIGTLVVSRQVDYIRNKNLGLNKENLGYVWMSGPFKEKHEIAKRELLANPGITSITFTSQLPINLVSAGSGWDWDGKPADAKILMNFVSVDDDYLKTFQMEMAAGRFFAPEFATDSVAAVLNEEAVKAMGMDSPIGKRLRGRGKNLTIIGVIKDFNFKPIQTKIEPLVLLRTPAEYFAMVMRTKSADISATMAGVERVYKKFNAETPFYFNFVDDDFNQLYRAETRIGTISQYCAILAIFIAALGLYGLASYTTEQRTKEIGIRKVLGATSPGMFLLLAKEFIWIACVANLIAWPVAYFIMSEWLLNYAYHASLGISVFLIAAGLALIVVLVTVSYHAVRASLANPVDALRYE